MKLEIVAISLCFDFNYNRTWINYEGFYRKIRGVTYKGIEI